MNEAGRQKLANQVSWQYRRSTRSYILSCLGQKERTFETKSKLMRERKSKGGEVLTWGGGGTKIKEKKLKIIF